MDKHYQLMFSQGCFRDNYNATSVLWRTGLSWWDDVLPLCDKNQMLQGEALLKFQHLVRTAKLQLPTRKQFKAEGVKLAPHSEYSLAGWKRKKTQKTERFKYPKVLSKCEEQNMGAVLINDDIHFPVHAKYFPLFWAAANERDKLPKGPEWDKIHAKVNRYSERLRSAGYFRDPYNELGVLWCLNLSWNDDVRPLCERDIDLDYLYGTNLRKFRRMLVKAKLNLPTKAELIAALAHVAPRGKQSVAGHHRDIRKRYQKLIAFVDEAIKMDTSIECSF